MQPGKRKNTTTTTITTPLLSHEMWACVAFLVLAVVGTSAAPKPDLTVDVDVLAETLTLTTRSDTDECLVDSGCLPDLGEHTLLRFATRVHNVAPAGGDLELGIPPGLRDLEMCDSVSGPTPNSSGFCWHACHSHRHFMGFVSAELLYANGSQAAEQVKHSFCLADTGCSRQGSFPKYNCNFQGIAAGCYDTYTLGVDCQWIVVDNLPLNENVTLRVEVDPDNFFDEGDETNNVAEYTFRMEQIVSSSSRLTSSLAATLAAAAAVLVVAQHL